jgi:hypothetical protein
MGRKAAYLLWSLPLPGRQWHLNFWRYRGEGRGDENPE